jgi:hypothetical protein
MFLNLEGNTRTAPSILEAIRVVLDSQSAPCSRSDHAASRSSNDPPHVAPEDAEMDLTTMGSDEDATNGRQVQIPFDEDCLDMDLSGDCFIAGQAKQHTNRLESDTTSTFLQTRSEAAELVETLKQETSLQSLRRQDNRTCDEVARSSPIALTEYNATATDRQSMGDIHASSSIGSTVDAFTDASETASHLRCTGEKLDLASGNVDPSRRVAVAEAGYSSD